jgi:hypothetical protein
MIEMVNKKFNRWTVIKFSFVKNESAYWLCLCDCGKYKNVNGASLRNNTSKSCGCLRKDNPPCSMKISGKKFNRLYVIKKIGFTKNRQTQWLCLCDCGNTTIVTGSSLKNAHTKSCGCYKIEKIKSTNKKHGMRNSPTYQTWSAMIQRCHNPNNVGYKNYGQRGIDVCKRWRNNRNGFQNFLLDMGERPNRKYFIERINNNKGYTKNNCIWTTKKEQTRNMRRNINITFNNKTQCLMDWSIELGIPYNTLRSRIFKLNWPVNKALTTLTRKIRNKNEQQKN